MSLLTVIKVIKLKGGLISFLLCSSLFLSFNCVNAKPANAVQSPASSSSSLIRPSQPIYTARSSGNSGKTVLSTWNQDGSWQASARLPTSSQTGGNDRSRYKIRRDGSLSLALQNTKPHKLLLGNNNYQQTSSLDRIPHDSSKLNWGKRDSRVDHNAHEASSVSARRNDKTRQFSPAELRSFSVVISDVDVTGNYNSVKDNMFHAKEEDAYAKAGIDSYHLKSNSIHRMNASWKLKPRPGNPTSSDLLEFLSYFANGDGRATRSENPKDSQLTKQPKRPLRKILGQKLGDDESGQINQHDDDKDENKQPFLTWQESSRNIPLMSTSTEIVVDTQVTDSDTVAQEEESQVILNTTPNPEVMATEVIKIDGTTNTEEKGTITSGKGMNESKVVLHELISTLEELNKNIEKEESENASSSKVAVTEEKSKANETNGAAAQEIESTAIPEDGKVDALRHSDHETEIDQISTVKSENQQQQQVNVDVQMSEFRMQGKNEGEKEGDVFVQNDTAEFNASSNSNNNIAATLVHNSSSSKRNHDDALDGTKSKKRRSAKSAFFDSTKSTNSNDGNNNTASTSATSLEDEESTDNDNSRQRMKITDPQQTASDLKKLMSLILKSDGNRNAGIGGGGGGDGKSGTQVVNIVITPNQDESSMANHPQVKNNAQKILFLKNPQVKQMLDIALTDPALSTAAQKIAAALETNPFPNPISTSIDHRYSNLPSYIVKPDFNDDDRIENVMHEIGNSNAMGQKDADNVPSTPDGFPLTGTGFLNLNHPNLQFHQALHHMVVNGSTPTSINATTKTNIINIFVINFKENNKQETTGVNQQAAANQSPFRINIKPSPRPPFHRPKPSSPFSIRPHLIESVRPTTPNPLASFIDPSLLFNNKMGLAAGVSVEDDENEGVGMSSEKNYEPNKHLDIDRYGLSNPDKINIFDLLPGDIGAVTAVQYAPGVGSDSETNENHNISNKNQTVSHFMMTDNYNAYQQGSHNNSNSSDMVPLTMPSYGDYLADFLPDRSREPPGSENMKPHENENINDHNILSILTSSRKPSAAGLSPYYTSSGSNNDAGLTAEGLLPPSLAHLEWIFKNQPPPKPQISPQTDASLMKRKGQTNNNEGNAEDSASESMMEPDETGNSLSAYHGSTTQELIQYLLQLQNVTRPLGEIDFNSVSENMTIGMNSTLKPQTSSNLTINDNSNIGQSSHHNHYGATISSDGNEKGSIVEYTTKPPAFWKFGNKLPVGAFAVAANAEEALNNRLRKLLTAFGYSALPTLAAGAAATWPYWVPLVATGRKRRRRRNAVPSHNDDNDDGEIREIIKKRAHQFLNNLMTSRNNENGTASLPPILAPSDRQLLSKSTKNSRREGTSGEQKWIKVDVITATAHPFSASSSSPSSTSSSPTLLSFGEMNGQSNLDKNETSFHSQSHNNRLPLNTKNNRGNNSTGEEKHDERNSDSSSKMNDDDNHAQQKQQKYDLNEKNGKTSLSAEQQLDVPLLKNFLKNVLYNELSLANMNNPSPSPILYAYSSSSPPPPSLAHNVQNVRHPPPATLPFLSASLPTPKPFLSSTSSPPLSEPVVLSQVPIFTPTLNKLITKNGHHHFSYKNPQQQTGGHNKNNIPSVQNTPFSRPSSTSLPPSSLLLFPEYNNKGEDDSAEEQETIAGSDKKVISISTFSTPSPTSVYIHNRGDGTTSVVTTKAPASASLAHWQSITNNNNSPWGSAFGGGVTSTLSTTSSPDNISSSTTSSVTTTFANLAAAALHGHNDDMIHHHHQHLLSSGQTFNDANNHHSSSNVDYFLNHFNQSNKRLQKIKLADSIKDSERSYTSAALLPLWFPILFGHHSQLSSKLKHAIMTKKQSHAY